MKKLLVVLCLIMASGNALADVRIKDIASIRGMRDTQLVGYGLVVGLNGTGDSLRNSAFTEQSLQSMLDRMGVSVRSGALRTKNVAAVMITCDIPPLTRKGARFDVSVASLGDSTSLMGGSLVLTPLSAADGRVYAVAQGQVTVTGFSALGQAEALTQGVPTAGRIPNGAILEASLPNSSQEVGGLVLDLRNPDYSTLIRTIDVINNFARQKYGRDLARDLDSKRIEIQRPRNTSRVRLLAEIGDLSVRADIPARIVIDSRTGTIIIGQDVRIGTVAVTHGSLTVRVTESPVVSQPQPFSQGSTVTVPQSSVEADQQGGQLKELQGASLRALVRGLNQLGLKPSGIIAILQGIKTSGALQAELVIQ
jgi:flagellar P-ring protein precursor FlgI